MIKQIGIVVTGAVLALCLAANAKSSGTAKADTAAAGLDDTHAVSYTDIHLGNCPTTVQAPLNSQPISGVISGTVSGGTTTISGGAVATAPRTAFTDMPNYICDGGSGYTPNAAHTCCVCSGCTGKKSPP